MMAEIPKIRFSGAKMNTTIQIRSKGTITLPTEFRNKYGLEEGEALTLIDVGDGSFFLVPKVSKFVQSADKVAKKVKEANVTLDELFETLDEERKRFYKEHYVKE
jgi:AbrB family looped-hinge helix DNA binding protein